MFLDYIHSSNGSDYALSGARITPEIRRALRK